MTPDVETDLLPTPGRVAAATLGAPGRAPGRRPWGWLRLMLVTALAAGALFAFVLFAYELALARVPQHRAALERLVRAQTGLDIRFNELGLRWGWYGPEAVFRRVELDEPGSTQVLLRAPELVVGFDAWRTLRSGHPEAGRIELVAPDIDFAGAGARRGVGTNLRAGSRAPDAPRLDRVAILQRWRGGRVDIEGGTLRLPDPGGGSTPFTLQIRRASLRRSDEEWSVFGLVFLPDRLGRTARIVLRVNGDLDNPAALSGSLRLEARRLLFPGCRDFLAGAPGIARYLPRGGSGDLTVDLDFEHGRVTKAGGNVQAAGLVFAAPGASAGTATSVSAHANLLVLDRLHGNWRVAPHGAGWHIRVDSLELGRSEQPASLLVDVGDSVDPRPGEAGLWVRGSLERAPLGSVAAIARWLAPNLDLAGVELNGVARNVKFDWDPARPDGGRLQTSARFEDVVIVSGSHDFTLGGLGATVAGNEGQLTVEVQSRVARLELAQSRQYPLSNVHVAATLRINSSAAGWQITTDAFLLEHRHAVLSLTGALRGGAAISAADAGPEPEIIASGTLMGADIPFVERLLGENTAQAFGAAASRLTAGRIQNAEFQLRGPISQLPFGDHGTGFTGSLTVRDAILSGGDLWPDTEGIDAHVEWHGARIQATLEAGHAGAFQLASARTEWNAVGGSATHLTGHVSGRIEDALAWLHAHPRLQEYAPGVQDIAASGDAAFDFNVSVPAYADAPASATAGATATEAPVVARVATFIDRARVQAVAGLPPLEDISGSFVFDAGRLQRSTLTGAWLGGPVTLRVGEHREKGARVFAVQAQGVLDARQFADLANATGTLRGTTDWTGELAYLPAGEAQVSHWRIRADSSLLGVVSSLPQPFSKQLAAPVPLHIEVAGTEDAAQLRVSLGDRLRSTFALSRPNDAGWELNRGAVRFGTAAATLPSEPVVMILGRVNQLDLPAYALAWRRLRRDSVPPIRAQIVAGEMAVAGRSYAEVTLQADRTAAGTELRIDSAGIQGTARWPTTAALRGSASTGRASAGAAAGTEDPQSAQLHLTRLDLPDAALPGDGLGLVAALGPAALVAVDELNWRGHSLGRLTASVTARNDTVVVDDLRLVSGTHDSHGALRCQRESELCRLSFVVDSTDAAATLEDFGFKPELAATGASLRGDVEWRPVSPEQSWLAGLRGTVSMKLADGTVHGGQGGTRADDRVGDATAPSDGEALPFALLAVPALVEGLDAPGAAGAPLGGEPRELRFARLEADFELLDGQATTANLHFDGDAEILIRGRTGLVSRDYDQQVWVLRGEERLPAAVRRFGATPRVAAVWLSLRELFTGSGAQDRSGAVLRLQGSWDDPMVVAAN